MNSTPLQENAALKEAVRRHWEEETCGTRFADATEAIEYYRQIRDARYRLEPHIHDFQNAPRYAEKRVLEIGVGAGSDYLQWQKHGARSVGIDLTVAAIRETKGHLAVQQSADATGTLAVADAERLPFREDSFDCVYSYGVLHHSPDTEQTLREARRILKPGGDLRIMIYHRPCWTGAMLWLYHYAFRGKPFTSQYKAMYEKLESPGTKSYTVREAHALVDRAGFGDVRIRLRLGPGDLLLIRPSRKYQSGPAKLLWKLYPRLLVRLLGNRFGIIMLIEARKTISAAPSFPALS